MNRGPMWPAQSCAVLGRKSESRTGGAGLRRMKVLIAPGLSGGCTVGMDSTCRVYRGSSLDLEDLSIEAGCRLEILSFSEFRGRAKAYIPEFIQGTEIFSFTVQKTGILCVRSLWKKRTGENILLERAGFYRF